MNVNTLLVSAVLQYLELRKALHGVGEFTKYFKAK